MGSLGIFFGCTYQWCACAFIYPQSMVPVFGGAVINVELDAKHDVFSIAQSGDEGERKHLFAVDEVRKLKTWLAALAQVVARKNVVKDSLMECYMQLHQHRAGNYVKRIRKYVVMEPKKLLIYSRMRDAQSGEDAEGEVALTGATVITLQGINKRLKNVPHGFGVARNGDEGEREWLLEAASEADRVRWVDKLLELKDSKSSRKVSYSIKEGYLRRKKLREGLDFARTVLSKASKSYYVLTKDALEWYKARDDVEVAGHIVLNPATRIEVVSEPPLSWVTNLRAHPSCALVVAIAVVVAIVCFYYSP